MRGTRSPHTKAHPRPAESLRASSGVGEGLQPGRGALTAARPGRTTATP